MAVKSGQHLLSYFPVGVIADVKPSDQQQVWQHCVIRTVLRTHPG
jgi:hypothetical protein